MSDQVTLRVPGSTSNLGSGFDAVGIAIDRWLELHASRKAGADGFTIERSGALSSLTIPPEQDKLYAGFAAACRVQGRDVPIDITMRVHSDIPVARGLGSSGAAIVAGAAAANALLDLGLSDDTLAAICTDVECHPENVVAAIYGGATLSVRAPTGELSVAELDIHSGLGLVFAVPAFAVDTERAREVLPDHVPHSTAVAGSARSAALVLGLERAQADLLVAGLDDLLHVPHRQSLVRGYEQVVAAAREAGAFGATLSGSGSTIVAVSPLEQVSPVGEAMARAWRSLDVDVEVFHQARPASGYTVGRE